MTPEEKAAIKGRSVLLFDGLCGLCNGVVRFLIRCDPDARLLYAPLEGSLGRELFPMDLAKPGVVLVEAALSPCQIITTRSEAVVHVLRLLPGTWPFAGLVLAAIPRWLRETGYGFVARFRYRLFGRHRQCPLPSVSERSRILGVGD